MVDEVRVRALNDAEIREGDYVLYWMTAARRPHHSHALDHAIARARERDLPLLVFEPLRAGYPHASKRIHSFVIDGMRDNAAAFDEAGVAYLAYVEPEPGAGKGLLLALAECAALVVGDDYPVFFLPRMLEAAAEALEDAGVPLEVVDGNGLLPMWHADRTFLRAVDFRRHVQKTLPGLFAPPAAEPALAQVAGAEVPDDIAARWPSAIDDWPSIEALDDVPVVEETPGGCVEARRRLRTFIDEHLEGYEDARHPDDTETSHLSAHLHFGHIGAYEVFEAVTGGRWKPKKAPKATAKREGWWGLPAPVEAFLEQLCTWRELAFNGACFMEGFESFEGLPDWAHKTLDAHRGDPREEVSFEDLEAARSGDPIWDAAQRELLETGFIHTYLRMTWGKKIFEWSPSPEEAWRRLVLLNDRYALDGRDPNSYASLGWILGRYDRAWGPERPVFGKIRYMSSDATKRKLHMKGYLERFGEQGSLL